MTHVHVCVHTHPLEAGASANSPRLGISEIFPLSPTQLHVIGLGPEVQRRNQTLDTKETRLPQLLRTHRGSSWLPGLGVVIARKKSVSHRPLFSFTVPEKASALIETSANL